jgi:hypothetical protein
LLKWSNCTSLITQVENVDVKGPTRLSVPGYSKPQVFGEMASFDYPVLNSGLFLQINTECSLVVVWY